jgi:hypothetical protein
MIYESHGTEKSGFQYTLEKIRVRTKRLKNVDTRSGRIFCTFETENDEMTALDMGTDAVFNFVHSDSDSVIKAFVARMAIMAMDVDQCFSAPHVHNRNPAENYMRVAKEAALAMQAMAGLLDSLCERCWSHAAEMCGLALPKKVYNEAFRNITPAEAFTGQRPRWKDVKGFVMGMQCWYLLEKETRPQLGIAARHDGWGFWVGRDVESWSHMVYDPYTQQLVSAGHVSGSPNTLYKDVMGVHNHLRLEILRAARGCTEHDHRNIMAAIDRSQLLRKEQAGAYRDAMRYGGHGSEAAEKALLVGRMLDESAMSMLLKFEEMVKNGRVQRQVDGGAAAMIDGGAANAEERSDRALLEDDGLDEPAISTVNGLLLEQVVPPRRSRRESKHPVDSTSWKSATWEQTVQQMHSVRVTAGEVLRSAVTKDELFVIMRTLIVAEADDIQRLHELNILDGQSEEDMLDLRRVSLKSWKEATDYDPPKSVRDSQSRLPDEAAAWMEAITGELDWFVENGKVDILNGRWHTVDVADIPPYK